MQVEHVTQDLRIEDPGLDQVNHQDPDHRHESQPDASPILGNRHEGYWNAREDHSQHRDKAADKDDGTEKELVVDSENPDEQERQDGIEQGDDRLGLEGAADQAAEADEPGSDLEVEILQAAALQSSNPAAHLGQVKYDKEAQQEGKPERDGQIDHLFEETLHPRADISESLPRHVFELGADLLRNASLLPLGEGIGARLELKTGLLVRLRGLLLLLRKRVRIFTGNRRIVGRRERLQRILQRQRFVQFPEFIIRIGYETLCGPIVFSIG